MPIAGKQLLQHTDPTAKYSTDSRHDDEDDQALTGYLSKDRSVLVLRHVQEVASSTIIDSLSAQWWSLNLSATVIDDLLENLMPLVVLACEKVINEADEKHLIETTTPDRSFNPVNRLASFLMRNNPKYIHYSALSPYHYSMKTLLHTKRVQVLKVFGDEENSLRSNIKERQNQRQLDEDANKAEQERRRDQLKILFQKWNVPERGWVQTKLINNMIKEFQEVSKSANLKPNITSFSSHRMHLGTFTENFLRGLSDQPANNFDSIIESYHKCAETYTNIYQEHKLDKMLQHLFLRLDTKKSGYLLRKNVLRNLQNFYNGLNARDKRYVFSPDQWPVLNKNNLPETEVSSRAPSREEAPDERRADTLVTNEQSIVPTIQTIDTEVAADEDETKVEIMLRDPSAYDIDFRYIKELSPIYNLEHFEDDENKTSIPFDELLLNQIQFSSLLLSFLGADKNEKVVCALIDHFRFSYKETNEDANNKRLILHERQVDSQRRSQTDNLFEKLNVTCSRHIKVEPLTVILRQYKDGTQIEHIEPILLKYQEKVKLNSTDFYEFLLELHQTLNEALGGSEKFDDIMKFLDNQVPQLSANDRTRMHTRRQWLKKIRNISYRNMEELYKEVFEILEKDSETFGNPSDKTLSIYIAMIDEDNDQVKYIAATNDQSNIVGKTLKRAQGISFQILESGKWAYINQTKQHTRLHFFNSSMKNNPGSLVLVPLKDLDSSYSCGLLAVDTIRDKKEKAFVQHEVQFYEGVASTIGETMMMLKFDQTFLKIIDRFIHWIENRFSKTVNVDYYTYDPMVLNNLKERTLQHVLRYKNGTKNLFETPEKIDSFEQVFKYELERAAITGQSVVTFFLGRIHFIHVLQKKDQQCFALIDTHFDAAENFTPDQRELLGTMYRCLSMSVDRLEQDFAGKSTKKYFNYEKQSAGKRIKYLFDRMSFKYACQQIKRIPKEKLNDFIQHKVKWNEQIKQLFATISQIVKRKDLNLTEYDDVLIPDMIAFDPSSSESLSNDQWSRVDLISKTTATTQQIASDIGPLFSEWLFLANEIYKISK